MSTDIINCKDLVFSYKNDVEETYDASGNPLYGKALDGLTLSVPRGSYCAVLGPNGSGKSTFAKLIDILEAADSGDMQVLGYDAKDQDHFWDIRENCSYVFQNPDNQIVGTTVEEDVAFGPENLGIPNPELRERVDKALEYVGLRELALRQTTELSGGQKQKLAIAGALAMKPTLLILDESTAMLDPEARDEFLELTERMRKERDLTVLAITHDMYEASRCEKIYVISEGKLFMEGRPEQVFAHEERIRSVGLQLPVHISLTNEILKMCRVSATPEDLKTEQSCIAKITETLRNKLPAVCPLKVRGDRPEKGRKIMSVEGLGFTYDDRNGTVLDNMDLDIYEGEVLALVGKSGCGKTTLITHLNGLLRPQTGEVTYYCEDGRTLRGSVKKEVGELRKYVGLVLQYPEYQLFEETVEKDIAYGLKKQKLSDDDIRFRVREAMKAVGLDESVATKSPFELSGGQKRRVAMAGVLVMRPKVLVLDEPASGLDPRGRKEMFGIISNLRKRGTTVVLVSHNMDEAAEYADRICVIKQGKIEASGDPDELFESREKAMSVGLQLPRLYDFSDALKASLKEVFPGIVFDRPQRDYKREASSIVRSVIVYRGGKDV
ncbi:MAG: ATP-binding cassette domain-containing protein [Clostridiales bacterium]|nr:ATP-binding cassette domain-containing protein [Clostridiales bacterium]